VLSHPGAFPPPAAVALSMPTGRPYHTPYSGSRRFRGRTGLPSDLHLPLVILVRVWRDFPPGMERVTRRIRL